MATGSNATEVRSSRTQRHAAGSMAGSKAGSIAGPAAAAWFLALFAGVTWWLAIPADVDFSFDDREAVVGNPAVDGRLPWTAAFERDYWHHVEDAGHYRPLATLLLRFDHARDPASSSAHSPEPSPAPSRGQRVGSEPEAPAPRTFRLTNVLLHAAIVLALGLALARLDASAGLPFPWFGLGLFAVHPAGADVVAWISGRTSLVSAAGAALGLCVLSGIHRGAPRRASVLALAGGLAGVGLALLGKEDGVVLALVLPALAWRIGSARAGLAAAFGAGVAIAIYLALRTHALGSSLPSAPSAPLASLPLLERATTGLTAWSEGWLGWMWPWPPPPPSLAPTASRAAAVALPVALAALWGALRLASRVRGDDVEPARRRAAFGMGAAGVLGLAACMLPLVQLVPAGEVFAQRFLYQPMLVGVFVPSAVAALLGRCVLGRTAVTVGCLLVLVACAVSSVRAASTYTNRLSYWSAFLPDHAEDARVQNAIGEALREAGRLDAAEARFRRAHALRPTYSPPLTSLGTLAMRRDDWESARTWLERAVAVGPSKPVPHANLANVMLRLNRPEDAVPLYRRAAELAPGRADYARGLARALVRSGDVTGAEAAIRRALELAPDDAPSRRLEREIQKSRNAEPAVR